MKTSRVIKSVLLSTMLVINFLAIIEGESAGNGADFLIAGTSQNSPDGIKRLKAHWEDTTKTKFLGCWDKGSDCKVVALFGIGVSFSEAGIHLQ